jgi:IS4 transposase
VKNLKSNPSKKISKREYKYLLDFLSQLILLGPTAIYTAKDIAKAIIKASTENNFIDSVCNQMRKNRINIPTGNDVFYHLTGRKLKITDVYNCIDSMIKTSFIKAKRCINFRVPLNIAIDYHVVPYYGKGNGELARWVKGCKKKRGTKKGFHFITVQIVVRGRRFTIAVIPVDVFDSTAELLERLIKDVRRYIRIRYVFLDMGFYSVDAIKKLMELGVGFVIPIVKYEGKDMKDIRKLMRDSYYAGNCRFKYTLGTRYKNVTFTVVVMMGEKDVIGFATNTKLRAETIGDWYSKRWGIETGYRVKEGFRARTCSRSAVVRLLLNMVPFVLYNLWALVNLMLRWIVGRGRYLRNDKSYVTAYEFCEDFDDFIKDS